jgi:hypothetical protein
MYHNDTYIDAFLVAPFLLILIPIHTLGQEWLFLILLLHNGNFHIQEILSKIKKFYMISFVLIVFLFVIRVPLDIWIDKIGDDCKDDFNSVCLIKVINSWFIILFVFAILF